MNNQRKSTRSQAAGKNENTKKYYALKTTGYGYVNYLEQRQSDRGAFTVCKIAAIVGDAEQQPKQYRYFNVVVSGKAAAELLWQHEQAIIEERNVFVEFCLHDVKPKAYEKKDGELGATNEAYLIGIDRLWIDAELLFESSYSEPIQQQNQRSSNDSSYKKSAHNGHKNNRSSQSYRQPTNTRTSGSQYGVRQNHSQRAY